jgi:hypothetical protein
MQKQEKANIKRWLEQLVKAGIPESGQYFLLPHLASPVFVKHGKPGRTIFTAKMLK